MTNPPFDIATGRQPPDDAIALGIDGAFIALLVDAFYDRIRVHDVLGPIFNDAIGDDWTPHLTRMKVFWSSVVLKTATYSGKPVPKHKQLSDVHSAHFDMWLALFRETLDDVAPSPAVADYFMTRADRIGRSLQLAMFGVPGIPQ